MDSAFDLIIRGMVEDADLTVGHTIDPYQVSINTTPVALSDGNSAYWVDILETDDDGDINGRTLVDGILATVVGGVVYWNNSPEALVEEFTS